MDKKGLKYLKKDKRLKEIIGSFPLEPLSKERDLFQDLVRSIVSQQLSVKAASTIYGRFQGLFSKRQITPRKILNKSIEEMRAAGMSNAKARYVQNVARFELANKLSIEEWRAMGDDVILKKLTSIKGVGEWTAQMIMMFSLHRSDVLPLKDVGIQNAVKKLFEISSTGKELEEKMNKIAEPWRPYRSLACRLLWGWLDNSPD